MVKRSVGHPVEDLLFHRFLLESFRYTVYGELWFKNFLALGLALEPQSTFVNSPNIYAVLVLRSLLCSKQVSYSITNTRSLTTTYMAIC